MTERRGGRLFATIGLVIAFAVGSAVVGAVLVVRGRVLDADMYAAALVATDAYERTYTEVLSDPELAELKEQLLGDLRLGPRASTQARALGTNVLRWTVPPSTLRAGTETVISAVVSYLRGDTGRLDADVAVDGVLERVDDTTVTEVRTLLAAAADRTVTSADAYRDAVADLAEQLAAGTVPETIPKIGGTAFDPVEVIDAIMNALGDRADDALRLQVTAAVLADDERNALITAAGAVVADHAVGVAARLDEEIGRQLDVVAEIAERARRPAADVAASLDTVRGAARWFQPLTAVAGALLALVAAAGLLWLHRPDRRRAGLVLGFTFVVAGLVNVAVWWAVARVVSPPLAAATGTGPDSWNLPAGMRTLLADIQGSIADRLADTVWRFAGVLMAAGVGLTAGAAVGTRRRAIRPRAALATGAVVAVVVAGGAIAVAMQPGADRAQACNGHAELCDRGYDEVVYAATHNAMSSPDIVPVWPEHDGDLAAQLDAGVRALLIDTHYWPPVTAAEQLTTIAQPAEPRLPTRLVETVYDTLGALRDGREGTFLCHIHCVFGAIPFVDALVTVREFLDHNPHEVVTLIIQDAITPADTVEVVEAAGLGPYLHAHRPDESWSTLGELIERGERLVVFAEEAGPPPSWYANAFEAMQETPFLFLSPEEFSCETNRGGPDAALFLMNHWVQRIAPDRVDAVNVNQLDILVERARQCDQERGQLPNFVAVNFYNIGDVIAAVDELNGVL